MGKKSAIYDQLADWLEKDETAPGTVPDIIAALRGKAETSRNYTRPDVIIEPDTFLTDEENVEMDALEAKLGPTKATLTTAAFPEGHELHEDAKRLQELYDKDEAGHHLQLKCPHCGAIDSIQEQDSGIRWNEFTALNNENGALLVDWEYSDRGDFEHDHYFCISCSKKVNFPDGTEHT